MSIYAHIYICGEMSSAKDLSALRLVWESPKPCSSMVDTPNGFLGKEGTYPIHLVRSVQMFIVYH